MKLHEVYENSLQPILREARTDIPGLDDLLKSGISFVVVGAVAVNAYSDRPRNTQDVDVLTSNYNELANYIHMTFPDLEMKQSQVVIRFSYKGKEIIDVMVPYNKMFESVLDDTRLIGKFNVASPEAVISMKFAAIMAAHRNLRRKGQDRLDIATIMATQQVSMEKIKQHLTTLYPQASDDFEAFTIKLKQDFGL